MLYKRIITPLKQYFFEWRGLGMGKWMPFFVLYVLLPVMNVMQYHKYGQGEMFLTQIYVSAFILIPVLAPFFVVFVFQEYYETMGNELLFLYKRDKLFSAIGYSVLFHLLTVPLFLVYIMIDKRFFMEFVRMSIVIYFVCSFAYFLMVLFHSIAITWVMIICYGIYNLLFHNGQFCCIVYYYGLWIDRELLIRVYLPMLGISILLFTFARFLSLRFDRLRYQ